MWSTSSLWQSLEAGSQSAAPAFGGLIERAEKGLLTEKQLRAAEWGLPQKATPSAQHVASWYRRLKRGCDSGAIKQPIAKGLRQILRDALKRTIAAQINLSPGLKNAPAVRHVLALKRPPLTSLIKVARYARIEAKTVTKQQQTR